MSHILPDIDHELDVIFGEFKDHAVVTDFVSAARKAHLTGTLYIGYPVLAIDDGRVEFDALLVSRNRGVVIFDLYSSTDVNDADAINNRHEQLYAALFNKLNSFKELRKGRTLLIDPITVSVRSTIADRTWDNDTENHVINTSQLSIIRELALEERPTDTTIQHLNAAIQRISILRPPKKRENVSRSDSKGSIIKQIEAQIANLDLWQKRGSIEYVNGPQRIRGLAGSGKTVVLALKAAYLHVKRPDWDIVVTFNTRSLYQQFETLIRRFVFAQINEEPDWERIHIKHAWGGSDRGGVYSEAIVTAGSIYRDFGTAQRMYGYSSAFDGVCQEFLNFVQDREFPKYDMLLIDEAQDLPASFFKLAYKMVKDPKRIVWAYDDLQNLGDLRMPSEAQLFGKGSDGNDLVSLRNSPDRPQEDIVLPRSYRNPPWTLVAAHGLGFGIRRHTLVQMFPNPQTWLRLGYRNRTGKPVDFGRQVVLERDPDSVPDFFRTLISSESLVVEQMGNRDEQYDWVAKKILELVQRDELEHGDILIVIPDTYTARTTSSRLLHWLRQNGLQGHVPGVTSSRDELFKEGSIAITHIHRAKGNEAPVVFVVDADYCEAAYEQKKRRNILFTAMTRSRAWTFITGVGVGMGTIKSEVDQIRSAEFALSFTYPDREAAERLAASSDLPRPDNESGSHEVMEDLRSAVRRARQLKMSLDDMPSDLQSDLREIYGPPT